MQTGLTIYFIEFLCIDKANLEPSKNSIRKLNTYLRLYTYINV